MSHTNGTSRATAVTTRQRIGAIVAWAASVPIFLGGYGFWAVFWSMTEGFSEGVPGSIAPSVVPICGWTYAVMPDGAGVYSVAPLHVMVVGVLAVFVAASLWLSPTTAIAHAKGVRFVRRSSLKVEAQNLSRQLHQRGRAGLFVGGRTKILRLGLALIGAVVILGTVLRYPETWTSASGAGYPVEWGGAIWLSLVGSLMLILGCLLMLPFRPEDDVVVDGAGNLRAERDSVALPPQVPQPQAPASV